MYSARQSLKQIHELVAARSGDTDAELLRHVTNLLVHTDKDRADPETAAFDAVLVQLLEKTQTSDRVELSNSVADLNKGPRAVLRKLARDVIEVAAPILERSNCLTDNDLVAIASEQGQKHMLSIARRAVLAPVVCDVLLNRGNTLVKSQLVGNNGASFSDSGYELLMEESLKDEELWKTLRRRPDVAVSIVDHVVRFYKHKIEDLLPLIEFVSSENDQSRSEPDKPVEQSASATTPAKQPQAATPEKPKIKSTEAMLIEAARQRRGDLVVKHLASLTHVDEPTVEKCLKQATLSALMILCKANKITSGAFAALLQFREAENGGSITATIPHLRRYEAMHADTAKRVIELSIQRRNSAGQQTAKPAEPAASTP
ncbi:MAG: DUF2336 domain-containing protein [Pseudomonadota bacterium]|nr:DUF2336 domain-containing protein [Pseudomonadota bacterium]